MDDGLKNALALSEGAHTNVNAMLGASGGGVKGSVVGESYWVPLILLARALRHQKAIALLAREGYATEAGIVALSQFELCLDILYIEQDSTRAKTWVEHSREKCQPWPVQTKMNALYARDPELLEANLGTFRSLSQVKHANPIAGPYGFPMRASGQGFTVQTHPDPDEVSQRWSTVIVLFSCYKLVEAAVAVKRCHSRFVAFDKDADRGLDELVNQCRQQLALARRRMSFPPEGKAD